MHVLNSESANRDLTRFLKRIYDALVSRNIIRTTVPPECGYFAFAALAKQPDDLITMDGSYFEVQGFEGYCRINLMAARRIYEVELAGALGDAS